MGRLWPGVPCAVHPTCSEHSRLFALFGAIAENRQTIAQPRFMYSLVVYRISEVNETPISTYVFHSFSSSFISCLIADRRHTRSLCSSTPRHRGEVDCRRTAAFSFQLTAEHINWPDPTRYTRSYSVLRLKRPRQRNSSFRRDERKIH